MKITIQRIGDHDFTPPAFQHRMDIAVDLQANIPDMITLCPGSEILVGTGWAISLPKDVGMFLFPRSGLGAKYGIVLGNLVGIVDGGYRQEVKVKVWNRGRKDYTILPGDRIAQAAFIPIVRPELIEIESLDDTDRGSGFGSSGR